MRNNHDNVNVSSKESFLDFSGGILQVKEAAIGASMWINLPYIPSDYKKNYSNKLIT